MKLEGNGIGDLFELDKVVTGLEVSMTQFVHGCIAAGCDYLPNVRGVGINKAFSFVKSGQLFMELKKRDQMMTMQIYLQRHLQCSNTKLFSTQHLVCISL